MASLQVKPEDQDLLETQKYIEDLVAEELALFRWPFTPRRILGVGRVGAILGARVSRMIPSADLVVIADLNTSEFEEIKTSTGGGQVTTIIGLWDEMDWGSEIDVVVLYDHLRHLDHYGRVGTLQKAYKSLRKGGCLLTAEVLDHERGAFSRTGRTEVIIDPVSAIYIQRLALEAKYQDSTISAIEGTKWSIVLFEHDKQLTPN